MPYYDVHIQVSDVGAVHVVPKSDAVSGSRWVLW